MVGVAEPGLYLRRSIEGIYYTLSFLAVGIFRVLILERVVCLGLRAEGLHQGPTSPGGAHYAEGGVGQKRDRVEIRAGASRTNSLHPPSLEW